MDLGRHPQEAAVADTSGSPAPTGSISHCVA